MGKRKSSLSRISAMARRVRLRRQNETQEQRNKRLTICRLNGQRRIQNETPEERERRLAENRIRVAAKRRGRKYEQKRQQLKASIGEGKVDLQQSIKKKFKYRNQDVFGALSLQKSGTRMDLGIRMEPSSAREHIESVDNSGEDTIEIGDEIKQEYDIENVVIDVNPNSLTGSASSQ